MELIEQAYDFAENSIWRSPMKDLHFPQPTFQRVSHIFVLAEVGSATIKRFGTVVEATGQQRELLVGGPPSENGFSWASKLHENTAQVMLSLDCDKHF